MGEMTLPPQPPSLVGRPLHARAIARLEAAGRLLRGETDERGRLTVDITPAPGELEIHAIYRVIQTLSDVRRMNLQASVNWVEDYGFEDSAPRPAIRPTPVVAPLTQLTPISEDPVDDDSINYELASISESERMNS